MTIKNIDPKLKYIKDFLKINNDDDYFVIPEYQRNYSWDITQCEKLFQDIENFINGYQENDSYFFGTIIISVDDFGNKLNLIDGQQRTITFLLLLKVLLFRINEILKHFSKDAASKNLESGLIGKRNTIIDILYKTDEDNRQELLNSWDKKESTLESNILENHSINELYKNDLKIILEAKDYNEAEKNCHKISGKNKDNKYTNFFRNFKFFYEKLNSFKESNLNLFAGFFLKKCEIIEIRSWKTEQAIAIFNSLNSTGLPLSVANIVSAQLYSYSKENKEFFRKQWEELINLSNSLSKNKINIDSILQEYMYIYRAENKNGYNSESDSIDVSTPGLKNFYTKIEENLLKNPIFLCDKFLKIANIWNKIESYPIIKLLLKFNENIKIFLISYLNRYNIEDISEGIVIGISRCLIRLFTILELVDSGYSSSKFKTFLFRRNIDFVNKEYSLSNIENDFDKHINSYWNKETLKEYLLDYDKNILVFLNEYLYAKENNLPFDFNESVNIEHIMPSSANIYNGLLGDAKVKDENEFKDLINLLGNKILLEENINKSISNNWFKTKKENNIKNKTGYIDSKYNIARSLVNYSNDNWTVDDIKSKTKKAADRIINFIFNE